MRKLAGFITILCLLHPVHYHAQNACQAPGNFFRASVDLIVVNVTALDRRGQPVETSHLAIFP